MKKVLYFITPSILCVFAYSAYSQSNIENQIENNTAFEYNIMREAVTLYPNGSDRAVKDGVLEIKRSGPIREKVIVIDRTGDEDERILPKPKINKLGPYSSFFLNASLGGEYSEVWATNPQLNRDMQLISNTSNLGFGIKMGNKFGIGRAEFEISYDNANFKSKQTPYQRKLSGPAFGFNLIADVVDDVVRPYIGIGAGYAKLNTRRTGIQTPLFGEAKDKSNSHYIKPILGVSFNVPGGSIFAEISYKVYNDAQFKGMYCTSALNCYESNVNYDSFGVYNLITGVTFYF